MLPLRCVLTLWCNLLLAIAPVSGEEGLNDVLKRSVPVRPTQPNVILLLMDDWGFGDVGAYGGPSLPNSDTHVRTPNIDKLARQGVIFTDYHTANPVCSPSRAALMTGFFPARLGIHTALTSTAAGNARNGDVNFLNLSVPTVTALFQKAGYMTGHFGKWHLGGTADPPAPPPTAYGIDAAVTFNSNDPQHQLGNRSEPYWSGNTSTMIIDHAIELIADARASSKPFYLNLWFHIAHATLDPTPEQMQAYAKSCPKLSTNQTSCPGQIYWSSQTDADAQIGRLMDALHAHEVANNTLTVFTADNGPEDVMVYHNARGTTGPFRGRKRSLYEGGHRVPFIVHWPARVAKGRVDHTILGGVDWLPTVTKLANVSVPPEVLTAIDGIDMSQAFLSPKGSPPVERSKPLFWEWRYGVAGNCWNVAPHLAMRNGTWKILMNADGSRVELYDMRLPSASGGTTGYYELTNVASDEEAVTSSMKKALQAWLETLPAGPNFTEPNLGCGQYPFPQSKQDFDAQSFTK